MFGRLFGRKSKGPEKIETAPMVPRKNRASGLEKKLKNVSTKDDVKLILKEIVSSRDVIVEEIGKVPESLTTHLVQEITSPLKDFISQELSSEAIKQLSIKDAVKQSDGLSSNQAVKQLGDGKLSSNQAVKQKKTLEQVLAEMKERMENLSQRHLKILNILVQNRDMWMEYETIGRNCNPQLTGSCIRGYIADLINSYRIPIEKKNVGRRSKVRVSNNAVKKLAIAKLID